MLKDVNFWSGGHSKLHCVGTNVYPPRVELGAIQKGNERSPLYVDVSVVNECETPSTCSSDSGVSFHLQFSVPLLGLLLLIMKHTGFAYYNNNYSTLRIIQNCMPIAKSIINYYTLSIAIASYKYNYGLLKSMSNVM